jgi:hypothetical protein
MGGDRGKKDKHQAIEKIWEWTTFMFGIHHPIFWGIYFFPKGSFQPLQELILGPSSGCRRRWPNWVGKWGPGWSWNLVDFWQMVVWSWKVKAGIRIFLFPPIPQVSFFL